MEAWHRELRPKPRHRISGLIAVRICLHCPPTCLNRDIQHSDSLAFSVTPSVKHYLLGTGILTCCPSPTPFGLGLGPDLPWAESPGPGTLRFSVGEILAPLIATYATISSCGTSSTPHGMPSSVNTMLLYQYINIFQSFGTFLKPR